MKKDKQKLVLTGGHAATTALAIVEEIRKRKLNIEIHWIGVANAFEGQNFLTLEAKIFPDLGIKFHNIRAGRIQARFSVHTIPSVLRIPLGFLDGGKLLREIRPNLILSFGGFAAFPVILMGFLFGIKIVIHEQTAAFGLANRLSSWFADQVLLSRDSSSGSFFPLKKSSVVGNPVLSVFAKITPPKLSNGKLTILVTGGSRGSRLINNLVKALIPALLKKYRVVHQTGDYDFDYFNSLKESLRENSQDYEVVNFIFPHQMANYFSKSSLIISRAGANSVSQILVTARPAILIPISWSRGDEQLKNALLAEAAGIAVVLPEDTLTSQDLLDNVETVFKNYQIMIKGMDKSLGNLDAKASSRIVDLLEEYYK